MVRLVPEITGATVNFNPDNGADGDCTTKVPVPVMNGEAVVLL